MSDHHATIEWTRDTDDFTYATYTRDHAWTFDGGTTVRASAAPAYRGNETLVDPEEAFVASLSSCHMLTFLALAAKAKLIVDSYRDRAVGVMERVDGGTMAVTRVTLRPEIAFAGAAPSSETLAALHHEAHERCFIANSVTTEVVVETPVGAG